MSTLRTASGALRSLTHLRHTHTRAFSTSHPVRGGGGGHESHYDAPGGWLFGVKPGEKYEKEGWEGPIYWGMGGSVVFAVVAYAFKPDTSIQTWALEEARRRLEKEGILPDPDAKKE
ncbi:NADH:ubiquinone oxidoreductase 11.6kD subunit [Phaeosphaeriaceae sp. PMI808]|nr:NADH:ubiquinone oxidoreductase 11.6kD subunit [Phaeosphaeriaceae sp. PMI808]